MNTPHNPTAEAKESLYTVSLHSRVPAVFKSTLAQEAALRGMTLSEYSASLLFLARQKGANLIEELASVKKQNALLEQSIEKLESKLNWMSHEELHQIRILKRNKDILLATFQQGVTTKQQLKQAGFNFEYVTRTSNNNGVIWLHVFDVCFSLKKDQVIISKA